MNLTGINLNWAHAYSRLILPHNTTILPLCIYAGQDVSRQQMWRVSIYSSNYVVNETNLDTLIMSIIFYGISGLTNSE